MSSVKPTPGPWNLMAGIPTNVLGAGGLRVARCDFNGDASSPEAQANACLIAAAPELLAALQMARLILADIENYNAEGPSLRVIDAAIAKATGGAA